MGKTVESCRIALEGEINRWSGFARALRKPDREAFDELMDMCRSYASESSCATNPIIFEPMVISILLAQQVRIMKLQKELEGLNPCKVQPQNSQARTTSQSALGNILLTQEEE
jgi:hypothetical protein